MKGSRFGCPLFLVRERWFWREYAAGQRSASDAWIFRAVPLGPRKNAKGGEQTAQLASLKQVPSAHQRILPRAKRKPCPENNSSEPGGRLAAGCGCAKEKKGRLWRERRGWRKPAAARDPVGPRQRESVEECGERIIIDKCQRYGYDGGKMFSGGCG